MAGPFATLINCNTDQIVVLFLKLRSSDTLPLVSICHLREHIRQYFDYPSLRLTVIGVSKNALCRSLKRLLQQGIIALKEPKKRMRHYILTDKGGECIKSYTNAYSYALSQYQYLKEKINNDVLFGKYK